MATESENVSSREMEGDLIEIPTLITTIQTYSESSDPRLQKEARDAKARIAQLLSPLIKSWVESRISETFRRQDAEEVVNDTLMQIVTHKGPRSLLTFRFDYPGDVTKNFIGWIRRSTNNRISDKIEKTPPPTKTIDDVFFDLALTTWDEYSEDGSPSDEAESKDTNHFFLDLLQRFLYPTNQEDEAYVKRLRAKGARVPSTKIRDSVYETFKMALIQQELKKDKGTKYDYSSIGKPEGITEGAVKTHIHQARELLKPFLAQQDLFDRDTLFTLYIQQLEKVIEEPKNSQERAASQSARRMLLKNRGAFLYALRHSDIELHYCIGVWFAKKKAFDRFTADWLRKKDFQETRRGQFTEVQKITHFVPIDEIFPPDIYLILASKKKEQPRYQALTDSMKTFPARHGLQWYIEKIVAERFLASWKPKKEYTLFGPDHPTGTHLVSEILNRHKIPEKYRRPLQRAIKNGELFNNQPLGKLFPHGKKIYILSTEENVLAWIKQYDSTHLSP